MKKVLCADTGKIYKTVSEASELTNVCKESICKACRKTLKSAGGCYWVYLSEAEEFEIKNNRPITTDDFGGKSGNKAVYCVELDKKFESAKIAARELGLHPSNIAGACKNSHKTCGKYHWKYFGKSK